MLRKVKAVYVNGAFIPQEPCDFPENVEVELTVDTGSNYAHRIVDRETRKEILEALLQRMRDTSMIAHARRVAVSE